MSIGRAALRAANMLEDRQNSIDLAALRAADMLVSASRMDDVVRKESAVKEAIAVACAGVTPATTASGDEEELAESSTAASIASARAREGDDGFLSIIRHLLNALKRRLHELVEDLPDLDCGLTDAAIASCVDYETTPKTIRRPSGILTPGMIRDAVPVVMAQHSSWNTNTNTCGSPSEQSWRNETPLPTPPVTQMT